MIGDRRPAGVARAARTGGGLDHRPSRSTCNPLKRSKSRSSVTSRETPLSRQSATIWFSEDELSHLAAKARLPTRLVLDTARETVALFRRHWNSEKAHLPLAATVVAAVERHLETVPIAG